MKILAIICELNVFHNGHAYLFDEARRRSDCDAVLCIMSGDFTQRGEMCVLDKYARAKHAVLGGADCALQLPAPFAVAPAEIFAAGAVKILSSIPDVKTIAFGCESGGAQDFHDAAKIGENEKFKNVLSEKLSTGESYIKAYAAAFEACGGDCRLVSSPNNILGLEYTKAIIRANAEIDILPIKRIGAGYNDGDLKENFSSASAIRKNLGAAKIKDNVPDFVYEDIKNKSRGNEYENLLRSCLFKANLSDLRRVYGCTEGLENKLKSLERLSVDEIVKGATSKRYSSSRIMRILCANALELYRDDCETYLNADLYVKPLAVKKERADIMLRALAKSNYPVVTGIDAKKLSPVAKKCFERDRKEYCLYNFLTHSDKKDYMILV